MTQREEIFCPKCHLKFCCNNMATRHAYANRHWGFYGKGKDICKECKKLEGSKK